MSTRWTDEQVAAAFCAEVQARFEAENAEMRAEDEQSMVELRRKYGDVEFERLMGDISVRDSFYWQIYNAAEITVRNNSVKVLLPIGAIYTEFVEMFASTSVAWSLPIIGAEIVDGEAHVTIKIVLIDYWDDERAAEWKQKHEAERSKP